MATFYHSGTSSTGSFGFRAAPPPPMREVHWGLLPMATQDDYLRALDVSGEPIDVHRLAFAKQNGVTYERVVRR